MDRLFLLIFSQIINSDQLQDQAAQHVAEFLANAIPDVTEDAIGAFLEKIGQKLTQAN